MEFQDWKPVILRGKEKAKKDGIVEVSKKNKANFHQTKLAYAEEAEKHETVSHDISKLIQQARLEKKMNQKELAQKVNVRPNIINDMESGKAIKDGQLLNKLQRVLGVKLTGKNVGGEL